MLTFLAALATAAPAFGRPQWSVTPLPQSWTLQGFMENQDLSAMATSDGRHCLVGADEQHFVQLGVVDRDAQVVRAGAVIPLGLTPTGGKKTEIDIEGIAVDSQRGFYYVTGSHGVGKKKGDLQPTRFGLFRVPVDPSTKLPDGSRVATGNLLAWLETSPRFAAHFGRPLQQGGFNIEGLAFQDGKLFFGVRGPNLGGRAFVIEADEATLFGGGALSPVVHELELGDGRGVRELTPVRGGFVLIAGNSAAEASKKHPVTTARTPDAAFELWAWTPGSKPTLIGAVPSPAAKAEGLLVLADTPAHLDVLVIHDGAVDGAPVALRLRRPAGK